MMKIQFADMWSDFDLNDNLITEVLKRNSIIFEFNKSPDLLFYSVFGFDHLNYDCIKVFITGEAVVPDFNYCDYAIGYDRISFNDRYIRWPLYRWNSKLQSNLTEFKSIPAEKKQFCSFVYSNKNPFTQREQIFKILNGYKKVNSGGAYLNNIGYTVDSKLDFESTHKFSLCIENAIYEGYTSEKIVDGFLANTIPIYYGNPKITEDFESGSFINLHDFRTLEEALRYIILIDTDDSLYLEKLNSNKLKFYKNDLIDDFIMSIMNNPTKRVPVNYYTKRHKYLLVLSSKINSLVLIKKILNYLSLKN